MTQPTPQPAIPYAHATIALGPVPPKGTPSLVLLTMQQAKDAAGVDLPHYLWQAMLYTGRQGEPVERLMQLVQAQQQGALYQVLTLTGDDLTGVLHLLQSIVGYYQLQPPTRLVRQDNPADQAVPDLGPYLFAEGAKYAQGGTGYRHVTGGFADLPAFLTTFLATAGPPPAATVEEPSAPPAAVAPPAPPVPPAPKAKPPQKRAAAKKPSKAPKATKVEKAVKAATPVAEA